MMNQANRREFLGGLAVAAGGLAATQSLAAGNDGRAAGYDVAPASDFVPLIPRRSGDPVTFTASLDKSPIKATSGGWARDITTKGLPIATDIAGAHLFLSAGGIRRPPGQEKAVHLVDLGEVEHARRLALVERRKALAQRGLDDVRGPIGQRGECRDEQYGGACEAAVNPAREAMRAYLSKTA